MKLFIFVLLLNIISPAAAVELFGVNLSSATRDELRKAVESAGVEQVQEAGNDTFFDTYKGGTVLYRANHLYLGFVKKDNKFAFAEYEFNGLEQPVMLARLNKKYGLARLTKGKFLSDQSYAWVSDGTEITFYQDWAAYKIRLTYVNPEALKQLKTEKNEFEKSQRIKREVYLEQAY